MNMIIMYLHVSDDPKQEKKQQEKKQQKNVNAVILLKPLDGASDQQSHGGDEQITCGQTADNTTDILW